MLILKLKLFKWKRPTHFYTKNFEKGLQIVLFMHSITYTNQSFFIRYFKPNEILECEKPNQNNSMSF